MTPDSDRKTLLKKSAGLQTRLEAIKADIQSGLSADLSEQAVELENREVLLEIERTTKEELNRIQLILDES